MRRRALPRRALLAATLGALYGLLILPAPATVLGITPYGLTWFVLAASLLFLHPWSYHAFVFWGLLWTVYRVVMNGRDGAFLPSAGPAFIGALLDVALPAAAIGLLMTSRYMDAAQRARLDAQA